MKKDEFEVRFKVLQVWNSVYMKKEFFIESIKILKKSDLIENDYKNL